jgi:hypothetical protein
MFEKDFQIEEAVPIYIAFEKHQFFSKDIQGVIESCTDILTTSYWLHVELGKNI